MRIGLVTAHYPPEFSGGTEVVVRAQALELARLGHDVAVYTGSDTSVESLGDGDERSPVRHSIVDGLPVARFHRRAHETYDLELARPDVRDALELLTADRELLHVHHWSTLHRDLVRRAALRVPVVVTLHDHFASCARFFRRSPVEGVTCPTRGSVEPCVRCIRAHAPGVSDATLEMALVERLSAFESELADASAVILPSTAHLALVRESVRLPEDRVHVIAHGVSQAWARAHDRAAAREPWDGTRPLVVLHFGHRSREKGTLDLVRAAAPLPPGAIEIAFSGRELEPGFDRELRRSAGSAKLVFHPPYGDEGPVAIAARADLAAFPSRLHESYALVVDEALALGLPAWVSDRGAAGERLHAMRDSAPGASGPCASGPRASRDRVLPGRVLPAESPAVWADAFRELSRAPDMLSDSRSAVPVRLRSAADAARELAELYGELLRAERPRPPRHHAA